ncbi:hypothetical protein O3G_MSEX008115 [Manduca sexta]|uniref:Uncharacterized protein n=1 Tax=Manduca sexta TaxID=7130 RepID=A0A922CP13_MANSE|nr:hypothetical protein O3G_MSEX008115 [Manduca sexta]
MPCFPISQRPLCTYMVVKNSCVRRTYFPGVSIKSEDHVNYHNSPLAHCRGNKSTVVSVRTTIYLRGISAHGAFSGELGVSNSVALFRKPCIKCRPNVGRGRAESTECRRHRRGLRPPPSVLSPRAKKLMPRSSLAPPTQPAVMQRRRPRSHFVVIPCSQFQYLQTCYVVINNEYL